MVSPTPRDILRLLFRLGITLSMCPPPVPISLGSRASQLFEPVIPWRMAEQRLREMDFSLLMVLKANVEQNAAALKANTSKPSVWEPSRLL